MGRYIVRRLLQAIGVLWAAYTVSFVVLDCLGNPVQAMAGEGLNSSPVDPGQVARLEAQYGFNKPVPVQYLDHLGRAVRGDFGYSVSTGQSVTSMMRAALPQTLQLTSAALLIAVVVGGGLAIAATYTRLRWLRQLLLALPPVGASLPTFWIGLMLVELFSFREHWFPAFGDNGLRGLVLPAVTLAFLGSAMVAQVLAKSLLTTLDEPYIETARAKGAGRTRVHLRHAVRNASLPALTVLGVLAGQLLANSVVVETVFSRDGLGRVTANAVTVADIPVVQGVVVFSSLVIVTINLIVDLIYPLLDPRIVLAGSRPGGTT